MFVVEKAKQKHNKISCKKMSSLCAPVKVEIKPFTESLTNIVLVTL